MQSGPCVSRSVFLVFLGCLALGSAADGDGEAPTAVLTVTSANGTSTTIPVPRGATVTFARDGTLTVAPAKREDPGVVSSSDALVRLCPLPRFEDYIRYVRSTRDGKSIVAKQTSVRTLRQRTTGRTLKLVGVHHLGAARYFEELGDEIAAADIVFKEGPPMGDLTVDDVHPFYRAIARWQRAMARFVGVQTDREWSAASRDERWRQLDLPMSTLNQIAKQNGWTPQAAELAQVEEIEAWEREGSGDEKTDRERRRGLLASLFSDEDFTLDQATTQDFLLRDSFILRGLVRAVQDEPDATIAMVYGAAHLYHLEPVIMQLLDCEVVASTWHECLAIEEE